MKTWHDQAWASAVRPGYVCRTTTGSDVGQSRKVLGFPDAIARIPTVEREVTTNARSCTECGRLTSCFYAAIAADPEPICIFCLAACALLSLKPLEGNCLTTLLASLAEVDRNERAKSLSLLLRQFNRDSRRRSMQGHSPRSGEIQALLNSLICD